MTSEIVSEPPASGTTLCVPTTAALVGGSPQGSEEDLRCATATLILSNKASESSWKLLCSGIERCPFMKVPNTTCAGRFRGARKNRKQMRTWRVSRRIAASRDDFRYEAQQMYKAS